MYIRSMDEVKVDQILDIFNRGFADYLIPVSMNDAVLKDYIYVNDISLKDSFMAFDDDDVPQAFTFTGIRDKKGWIGGLAVDPGHRNQGFGGGTLKAQLQRAKELELDEIWLECIEGNKVATDMYDRAGFRRTRKIWFLQWDDPGPGKAKSPVFEARKCALRDVLPHYDKDYIWPKAREAIGRMSGGHCELAERKGKVVGYLIAFPNKDCTYLWDMSANKYGEALLSRLLGEVRTRQVAVANLHDRSLLSILQRWGFVITFTLWVMRLKLGSRFW